MVGKIEVPRAITESLLKQLDVLGATYLRNLSSFQALVLPNLNVKHPGFDPASTIVGKVVVRCRSRYGSEWD